MEYAVEPDHESPIRSEHIHRFPEMRFGQKGREQNEEFPRSFAPHGIVQLLRLPIAPIHRRPEYHSFQTSRHRLHGTEIRTTLLLEFTLQFDAYTLSRFPERPENRLRIDPPRIPDLLLQQGRYLWQLDLDEVIPGDLGRIANQPLARCRVLLDLSRSIRFRECHSGIMGRIESGALTHRGAATQKGG